MQTTYNTTQRNKTFVKTMEIQFENIRMSEIWSSASFYFEFPKYEKVSKGIQRIGLSRNERSHL